MTPHGIRIPDDEWAKVEQRAADCDVTPSEVVRVAVCAHMNRLRMVMVPPVSDVYVRGWLKGFGRSIANERQRRLDDRGKPTSSRSLATQLGIRPDVLHHIEHGRMMPTPDEQQAIRGWLTQDLDSHRG